MTLKELSLQLSNYLWEYPEHEDLAVNFADLMLPKTIEVRAVPDEGWCELVQTEGYQEF